MGFIINNDEHYEIVHMHMISGIAYSIHIFTFCRIYFLEWY